MQLRYGFLHHGSTHSVRKMSSPLDRLTVHAQCWDLTIEQTLETEFSILAFGLRDFCPVVLKITKQKGDEWNSGEILRAFNGEGIVRVYESAPGAVLLERLVPGKNLVEVVRKGHDEDATEILSSLIKVLANHEPPTSCPTVFNWARGFDRYLKTGDSRIPKDLVAEAQQLYLDLASSSSKTMLLHGDLQHYNVLFDQNRGWVAIDPKGVVGELEYELGAILRNPVELPDFFIKPEVIECRLRILTNRLHLDHTRALQWAFAQAVLSAIWDIEDEKPIRQDHAMLGLAKTLQGMLD